MFLAAPNSTSCQRHVTIRLIVNPVQFGRPSRDRAWLLSRLVTSRHILWCSLTVDQLFADDDSIPILIIEFIILCITLVLINIPLDRAIRVGLELSKNLKNVPTTIYSVKTDGRTDGVQYGEANIVNIVSSGVFRILERGHPSPSSPLPSPSLLSTPLLPPLPSPHLRSRTP